MDETNIDRMIASATREDGVVYFVQAGKAKAVKIGWTKDLKFRLSVLQTGNMARLRVLLAICGCRRLESALHRHFSPLHRRGEWFWLGDEIREFVATRSALNLPESEYRAAPEDCEAEVRSMLEATESHLPHKRQA